MVLYQNVIEEQLSGRFNIIRENCHNSGRFLTQVIIYSGTPMLESGVVYVAKGDDLPEEPRISETCALVSVGMPPEAYLSNQINFIILDGTASQAQVLSELQHTFTRLYGWRELLYRALYMEKGVQGIVNEALRMFENPVYVHDKNYRIIAYAENRRLPGMELRYGFLEYGRISAQFIKNLNMAPGFNKTFDETEPAYWEKTGFPEDWFNCLYSNIRVGGRYCGRIFVDERVRPINKADYVIMAELTEVIQMALRRRNLFENSHLSYFCTAMVKLLGGEDIAGLKLDEELMDLGWNKDDPFFCFKLRLADDDSLLNAAMSICDIVESTIPDSQAFPYDDDVFVVANGRRRDYQRGIYLTRVKTMLEDFNLQVGVSLTFNDLGKLRKYYVQTINALELGVKRSPDTRIHYFEDYAMDYMLKHSINEFSVEMLCPRSLLKLIDYDRENNTTYAETLRMYLECDSSPAKTMERLFIHRSTLLYRLNRIQELIDTDLTDFRVKLHFLLAFQLLDL